MVRWWAEGYTYYAHIGQKDEYDFYVYLVRRGRGGWQVVKLVSVFTP
jgi:hypothetical protein